MNPVFNRRNAFNLALYHLAAAHPEERDRLYTRNLTAPMADGRSETIEWRPMAMLETRGFANDDLNDFLHLFPDHPQAQQVKQLLQGAIDAAQPNAL